MSYAITDHFHHHVQPSENGKVILMIEMEPSHVRHFLTMFESLGALFRVVSQKAQVVLATNRISENREEGIRYFQKYQQFTVDTFKTLRKDFDPSQHPKELISATLKLVKKQFPNASYDIVKDILRKSGELKKSGFYKFKE